VRDGRLWCGVVLMRWRKTIRCGQYAADRVENKPHPLIISTQQSKKRSTERPVNGKICAQTLEPPPLCVGRVTSMPFA
jgi:hypothetical protein